MKKTTIITIALFLSVLILPDQTFAQSTGKVSGSPAANIKMENQMISVAPSQTEKLMMNANRLLTVSDKLSSQAARLEQKIQTLPGNQTYPTMISLLNDMHSKNTQGKMETQQAVALLQTVSEVQIADDQTKIQQARKLLQSSLRSYKQAILDERQVMVALIQVQNEVKNTPLPEASGLQ